MALSLEPTLVRHVKAFTTFRVVDAGGAIVGVFAWGHSSIADTDAVEVTGTSHQLRTVWRFTFSNEIEASTVRRVRHQGSPRREVFRSHWRQRRGQR